MTAASKTPGKQAPGAVPFSFPIRVYWEDTDAGGVVYHASYVRFLERARTEWLRARGVGQQALRESGGLVLAIRSLSLDYLQPARLDDELQVSAELAGCRGASLLMTQEIVRDGQVLLRAQVRVACLVAESFKPTPLPRWLVEKFQ